MNKVLRFTLSLFKNKYILSHSYVRGVENAVPPVVARAEKTVYLENQSRLMHYPVRCVQLLLRECQFAALFSAKLAGTDVH